MNFRVRTVTVMMAIGELKVATYIQYDLRG